MSAVAEQEAENTREIKCQSCGAAMVGQTHLLSTVCPYCASPAIIQRPPSPDRPMPKFAVGFVVQQERACQLVQQWISNAHFFARSDFKRAAADLTRGVYLPAYLYSAVADSTYSAQIGENYTETETYTTTDSNGKTVTRTRTVTKTEYRPLSGHHACYMVDVIVTASQGIANESLEAIEPFDLRQLRRYSGKLISGWLAEEPSRSQSNCFRLARGETLEKVKRMLNDFMPGDSHRNLQFQTDLSREVIDLVMLPIWCFAVRYDESRPPVQILVNGQTGRVGGKVPVSTIKILVAVMAALVLALVVFALIASS